MNDEVATMKIETFEKNIENLQKAVENMPDAISAKIDASVNLKIENAIQKVKLDFYKWILPIVLGLLSEAVAVIFSYIK